MSKAPSFQFYPADWLNNVELQTCSLAAKGLLIDLMCLMHQAKPYGYLYINGRCALDKDVMKALRVHRNTYDARLMELLDKGVLKRDENGVIYSSRMVKDEELRQVRREAGKLGGNPLLNPDLNPPDKSCTPPSSSSSSSSSSETIKATPDFTRNFTKEAENEFRELCATYIKAIPKFNIYLFLNREFKIFIKDNKVFLPEKLIAHPMAVLEGMKKSLSHIKVGNPPWAYLKSVIKKDSMGAFEADNIKHAQADKKEFEKAATDPKVASLIKDTIKGME